MLKIFSRDNQRLKRARRARDGRIEDLIFVEGLRLVDEALRSNLRVDEVFFDEKFAENERGKSFLKKFAASENIALFEVPEKIFASLADTKSAQGIVLIAHKPETGKHKIEANLTGKKSPLVVVLHRTNNPSNLGAILRTAEAANVCGVVLTLNSADAFSPKSLRGAMGAAFRLPLWTGADFYEVLDWAGEINLISVAADVKARKNYSEIDWSKPSLLIFGSEAHGLDESEISRVEETLKIPMGNGVESLNLAVSAGVILFEAKRQTNG